MPDLTPADRTLPDLAAHSDSPGVGWAIAQIPGYEILGELGRGGMGVVYKARNIALGRVVALKMILSGSHASGVELRRFQTEASTIARINHPHIVQVYEVGEHAGKPYFSLEYCGGGTLERTLAGAPLPPRDAATLIERLARAVQAAHDNGVVHRDLKPGNILFTDEKTPKITDFGLAKRTDEVGNTTTGAVLGTPSYMAPEQARGARDVGPPVDVWALGAMLYECLTGRPPFRAGTAYETMFQLVHEEPAAPSRLRPGVPPDLATVALKCLEKDPARRYASAGAMADDLARYLRDEPIRARPVGSVETAARLIRRHPVLAALTGSVTALLALIAVGATIAAWHFQEIGRQAGQQRDRATEAEREGREKLWGSYLAQARAGRFSGQPGQRYDGLEALSRAAAMRPTPQLRDEAIACLALPDVRPAATRPPPFDRADGLFGLQWEGGEQTGEVIARRGPAVVARFGTPDDPARHFSLAPDGKHVLVRFFAAAGKPHRLEVWSLEPNLRRLSVTTRADLAQGFADGGRLFFATHPDGITRVYELPSARPLHSVTLFSRVAQRFALAPDGKRLLVGSPSRYGAEVVDLTTGRRELFLPNTPFPASSAGWHPTGQRFALGATGVACYEFPSGGLLWQREGTAHNDVTFTPDGSLLVVNGWLGFCELCNAIDGRVLVSRNGGARGPVRPGGLIAAGDSSPTGYYELSDLSLCRPLPRRVFDFGHPGDFSPDGRLLVLVGNRDVLAIDLATGLPAFSLPVGQSESVRFSPDGSALYTYGHVRGLQRWPLRRDGDTLHVGRPEDLGVGYRFSQYSWLATAPDGRLIASQWSDGKVTLLSPDRPKERRELPFQNPRSVALSPDGRYAALGTWKGTRVAVIELETNRVCLEMGTEDVPDHVTFSPDGRWLVVARQFGHRIYKVGQWDAPHRVLPTPNNLPTQAAFSGDGRFLAVREGPSSVRLLRGDTLAEVAVLPGPTNGLLTGLSLDAEGRRLLVSAKGEGRVWDLEAVRARLDAMGLAFDWPAYTERPRPGPLVTRLAGGPEPVVPEKPPEAITPLTPEEARAAVAALGTAGHDAALEKLLKAGSAVRPVLSEALKDAGPRRVALEAARRRLEVGWALTPRRVSLRLAGAKPREAALRASEAFGLGLTLGGGDQEEPVTLDLDGVPLWEAYGRLAAALGRTPRLVFGPGELELIPTTAAPPAAHVGPFRLSVARVLTTRETTLTAEVGREALTLSLLVLTDPRAEVLVGQARVTAAVDDRGTELATTAPPGGANYLRPYRPGSVQTVHTRLPHREARKLTRLALSLPVRVGVAVRPAISVPLSGGWRRSPAGWWAEVKSIDGAAGVRHILVSLVGPAGARMDPSRFRFGLRAADGKRVESQFQNFGIPSGRRVLPTDALFLASRWAALAPGMMAGPTELYGNVRFVLPARFAPAELVIEEVEHDETELRFELKDVPLP